VPVVAGVVVPPVVVVLPVSVVLVPVLLVKLLFTLFRVELACVPSVATLPIITTPTKAAMSAYSMAETPLRSAIKAVKALLILGCMFCPFRGR
jgi:hypothetical protein